LTLALSVKKNSKLRTIFTLLIKYVRYSISQREQNNYLNVLTTKRTNKTTNTKT